MRHQQAEFGLALSLNTEWLQWLGREAHPVMRPDFKSAVALKKRK
jgi:hypothetical protein